MEEIKKDKIIKCSLLNDCDKQNWWVVATEALFISYRCENCGGTKSVFRDLYGY